MTAESWSSGRGNAPRAGATATSRLLPPTAKRTFAEHRAWFGELPETTPGLLADVERSGLRGKGGVCGLPPRARIARHSARPSAPLIGASPAAYTSVISSGSQPASTALKSSIRSRVRV